MADGDYAKEARALVSTATGTFTPEQIAEIALGAADMLEVELGLGEAYTDLLSLMIASIGVRLSDPSAGLDAVITRAMPGQTPAEVRGWWFDWA